MQYIKYLGFLNQTVLRRQLILEDKCIIQSKEAAYEQLEAAEHKRRMRNEKRVALMKKD